MMSKTPKMQLISQKKKKNWNDLEQPHCQHHLTVTASNRGLYLRYLNDETLSNTRCHMLQFPHEHKTQSRAMPQIIMPAFDFVAEFHWKVQQSGGRHLGVLHSRMTKVSGRTKTRQGWSIMCQLYWIYNLIQQMLEILQIRRDIFKIFISTSFREYWVEQLEHTDE